MKSRSVLVGFLFLLAGVSSMTAAEVGSVDARCILSEGHGNTLRAALKEPSCSNIVLKSDYTVASGEFTALGAPLHISRCAWC